MKLVLKIKAEAFVELDGGYYRNDSPDKIQELIQQKLSAMTMYIAEGAGDPKAVRSSFVLDTIQIQV